MKIITHISRFLLGLIFLVFGLNGFLHFIPLPLPSDVTGQFMGALFVSHYYVAVFAVQVAGGILLLSNRFASPNHLRSIRVHQCPGEIDK